MLIAELVFIGAEQATDKRIDAEQREETRGRSSGLQSLRQVDARQIEAALREGCRRLEDRILVAVIEVLQGGYLTARQVESRKLIMNDGHPLWVADGQRAKQDGVDDAEDGRGCADAQA